MPIAASCSVDMNTKNYLFVLRRAPYCGSHVQEVLDMILTTAAFDQHVSLLFADDGVLQLRRGQNPTLMGLKETGEIFAVLEMYEVKALYVEIEALEARGLKVEDLILPVRAIFRSEVNRLLRQQDVLIPD